MRMQFIFVGLLLVIANSKLSTQQMHRDFQNWKQEHSQIYNTLEEEMKRFRIYVENLNIIQELNQFEAGGKGVKFATNYFGDFTAEEFQSKILLSPRPPIDHGNKRKLNITQLPKGDLPDSFDWRELGAVTPVKDQGSVGSCWTFSTTGNIEGVNFLATKNLVALSEEQIVDCDATIDPNSTHADCGVFGGWPYLAMQFVEQSGGLDPEVEYPYCVGTGKCYPCPATGYDQDRCGPPVSYCNSTQYPCRTERSPNAVTIDSWASVDQDEDIVAQALMEMGPLSILMNAQMLQFYKSGVWDPRNCNPKSLDHAVLIVGFGIQDKSLLQNEKPYWIIKNSWGKQWGEDGYFRLARGEQACGVTTQVVTALKRRVVSEQFIINQ